MLIEVKIMGKRTKSCYYVKCKECGWEGYTLLRGYGSNGYLYIECEKCGARNLYTNPPPRTDKAVVIGGSILFDLTHLLVNLILLGFHQFKISLQNGWTWFKQQPKFKKYTLGGSLTATLVIVICLIIFQTYFLHFLIAAIGTVAGVLTILFRSEE